MDCRERGMTLITVIFVLALLMVLALVLTDKVLRASRAAAAAGRCQQVLDAASAGLAQARLRLVENYAGSLGWQSYLSGSPGAHRYPEAPAFTLTIGDLPVEVYIRDNADGDLDWQHDNDLRLYLLARVAAPPAPETVVEALCGFPAGFAVNHYQQLQQRAPSAGPGREPGPVATFPLAD